ncbi:thrombospondin type 3 repeat-containing protein [Candidatus Poseidoniaceae archaeon]|nr:thrombospondin type 3 repeat-containing protein [Candidatus Poseidoniaceae archaeon]
MAEERCAPRKRYIAISDLFEARKDLFLASFLSILMLLCIAPLQPSTEVTLNGFESVESSGRGEVYEGDWAVARQQTLEYCYYYATVFAVDDYNDYLVLSECADYSFSVYMHSDWNVLLETVETNILVENILFSPNGEYLVVYSGMYFEIYQTSDWEQVFSGDVTPSNGNYVGIYAATWSSDGERIVFTTGGDADKMFEGPEWEEVTGTTSTASWVAHHPTEDILWYVNNDGTGNEYEFENIPFVGYQWVMKRSFTLSQGYGGPISSNSDGSMLLMNEYYEMSVYSTSDYSEIFASPYESAEATFSSEGDSIVYYYNEEYRILSTSTWQEQTSFDSQDQGCSWGYGPLQIVFSSEDEEIIVASETCYDNFLSSWSPDEDSDGVADVQDFCPSTSEDENADAKGCAPSQKDTDLDGINDRDDICPRTKTSDVAGSNGCSPSQLQDTDGDGVSDSDDICPGTLLTEFSNIYGCSSNQRDVDGDGLVDAQDNCPLFDVTVCPNVLSWVMSSEPLDELVSNSLQWSPAGEHAAMKENEGIRLVDDTFASVREHLFENESQYVREFLWMPNGVDLLVIWESNYWGDSECGYYLWDTIDDILSSIYTVSADCSSLRYSALSPDGTRLAVSKYSSSSYSRSTLVIDLTNHVVAFEDEDHNSRDLVFTHDGTSLIGLTTRSLNLWDVNDGYMLQSRSIEGADNLLLSPDGDNLYAYSEESIHVYSMDSFVFQSMISFDEDDGYYYSRPFSLSLEFSRSSDLLYVMPVNRTLIDGDWHYNSSMQTYYVDGSGSLELAMPPQVVNTSIGNPIFSPGQTSFIAHVDDENDYHEEGYYLWSPDSDGDGIVDTSDLCSNTILNESADETGCSWGQKDDDEDDVLNGQDLCINTPIGIGMLVDESGCSDQQVDEDFDGVCNEDAQSAGPSGCVGKDSCPSTPSGKVVDSTGCSWEQQDDDLDSVQNSIDICPDTSLGEVADSVGCGETQRDSDGDFVNDYWDVCSSTEINSTVDNFGCSDLQVDSDSDTVCNTNAPSSGPSNCTQIDICPNTESNTTVDTYGCSWNQRDDDGDGVFNPYDSCPDTSNPEVSPDGCSSWQRDSDNDGIVDILDECAKTPEDEFSNQVGCSEGQRQSSLGFEEGGGSSIIKWATIGGVLLVILLLGGFLLNRKKSSEDLTQPKTEAPQYATRGVMEEDGKEWIEFPAGSSNRFYRDQSSGQWVKNK